MINSKQNELFSEPYIEGMNLLEEAYSLGSRNIPADMVKEVQVLQAHQPIAALRGKSFSDNAALNLTLNNKAKSKLISLIDLGAGTGNGSGILWDNRLQGMMFGKKVQNLTMYKNNNTGKDIAAEIIPLTRTGVVNMMNESSEADLFYSSAAKAANVDPERYLFNESQLVAVNHLYKPNRVTDLRIQLSALHNKETSDKQSGTTYFYPSETITIQEAEHYSGQENRAEGEFTYLLNDSLVYIKNTLKGKIGLHKSNLELITNRQGINQRVHPQRKFLQNNFEFIKNTGKHSLSLYSVNSYTELPQYMTVAPGVYEELLNQGEAYNSLRQEAVLRSFQSDTYTYFQHKIGGFYLKHKVGIRYDNKHLTSDVYTDDRRTGEQNLANDIHMNAARLYAGPGLNYKNNFWSVQANIPLSFLYLNLKYKRPEVNRVKEKRFMPTPELNVKYELSAYWNATLLSSFSYTEPDIRQLYTGYLFSSYRSASAYEASPNYDKSWYNMLGVRFNNPLTGFFFSMSGFYNLRQQDIAYGYENTNGYLTLCKAYSLRHSNHFRGARSRLAKVYAWSKLYTALSGGYSHSKSQVLLEERLTASSLENVSLKFEFSLQPSRYINIDGNSAATYIKSALDYAGNKASESWNYRHEANLNLIVSSQWKARLANTLSHGSRNQELTYFTDASVTYSHRLFEVEISGRNLFNRSQTDHVYVSNLTEQYVNHALRPREFLVKILFTL